MRSEVESGEETLYSLRLLDEESKIGGYMGTGIRLKLCFATPGKYRGEALSCQDSTTPESGPWEVLKLQQPFTTAGCSPRMTIHTQHQHQFIGRSGSHRTMIGHVRSREIIVESKIRVEAWGGVHCVHVFLSTI